MAPSQRLVDRSGVDLQQVQSTLHLPDRVTVGSGSGAVKNRTCSVFTAVMAHRESGSYKYEPAGSGNR